MGEDELIFRVIIGRGIDAVVIVVVEGDTGVRGEGDVCWYVGRGFWVRDCCRRMARAFGSVVVRMLLREVGSMLLRSVMRRVDRSSCEWGGGGVDMGDVSGDRWGSRMGGVCWRGGGDRVGWDVSCRVTVLG